VNEEAPYTLDNSAGQVFAVTTGKAGQLVAATNGGVHLFSPEGQSVAHELMSFKQPGVTAGDHAAAAYDIGAETLVVADTDGNVSRIKPAGAVISARMNSEGWLAVVTEAPGYRAVVTVYDNTRKAVYVWYSGSSYVLTAAISDDRTLDEIVGWLLELGYMPSFCTACYREGRTGDRFMSLAKRGLIGDCCAPNALMTLAEYLEDYASPNVKLLGKNMIARQTQIIPSEKIRRITLKNLEEIVKGKRDFRF
jgi:hypothetical protein